MHIGMDACRIDHLLCCIATARPIIVHRDILIMQRWHISMAYGGNVTTVEGLLRFHTAACLQTRQEST